MKSDKLQVFSSAGGISQTNFSGNQFKLINATGSPWDGGQDGKYGFEGFRIRLDNYFSPLLFSSYDYFRVVKCETTLFWRSAPETGPVMGEMFWYHDKDSVAIPTLAEVANRKELKSKQFSNDRLKHKIVWTPNVISRERSSQEAVPVDYIQPTGRWLNSQLSREFRFGTLVMLFTTPNAAVQYPNSDAAVSIRHKVWIEMKGQKSVQNNLTKQSDEIFL